MAKNGNILNLIASIGAQEGLTDAQIKAMQATATVESGLNPSAVGDNGTSFGLFQHHIGGAGGSTASQARRYLDPETSIRERASQFRRLNIRGGRGAAALQRPADPSTYAKKVNAALRGNGSLNAPVSTSDTPSSARGSSAGSGGTASPSFAQSYLKSYLGYDSDPVMSSLYDSFYSDPARAQSPAGEAQQAPSTYQGKTGRISSYQDIERLAKQWGLNVQGDFQRNKGTHAKGSKHYAGKAVDFGDATNDPERMKQFAAYLSRNAGTLGISDVYYDPQNWYISNGKKIKGEFGGHSDHLHVDVR